MQIRNAIKADLKYIAEIYDNAYDEVKHNPDFGDYLRLKRPKTNNLKKWESSLYSNIKAGNILFLVATENGSAIGFCFVSKKDIPDSEISHVGILGIRILPEFRGKGIGTALVNRAIKKSSGKFDCIEASTMSINKPSGALLRKFGFKKLGTFPGLVKRGKRRIDMNYYYLDL